MDEIENSAGEKLHSFPALSRDIFQSFYSLMPGAPVMASKDLKNWKTVSYIFDKLTDSPKYDLSFSLPLDQQKGEGVGTVYGRGQ